MAGLTVVLISRLYAAETVERKNVHEIRRNFRTDSSGITRTQYGTPNLAKCSQFNAKWYTQTHQMGHYGSRKVVQKEPNGDLGVPPRRF